MSKVNVNAIEPSTGTDITLGASGDTITVPSGATIVNSGTSTGFGATLSGSTNNTVVTVTGANAMIGEAKLLFDPAKLTIGNASEEDTSIVFDGHAQDYYIGLDDTDDDLKIGLGSAVASPSSLTLNASVGTLDPNDMTLGLTGVSFSASIGSVSVNDMTVGLDGLSATFNVGAVDIFAYGDVDTGSNTSYSNVSTGSNDTYSDVATGSNTSYSDAA